MNIGFAELILILLIAFLVVGPKDLPKVARWLGRMVKKLRQMVREVKAETGWDEVEKEFKDASSDVNKDIKDLKKDLDITADLKEGKSDLQKSIDGIGKEIKDAEKAFKKTSIKK